MLVADGLGTSCGQGGAGLDGVEVGAGTRPVGCRWSEVLVRPGLTLGALLLPDRGAGAR